MKSDPQVKSDPQEFCEAILRHHFHEFRKNRKDPDDLNELEEAIIAKSTALVALAFDLPVMDNEPDCTLLEKIRILENAMTVIELERRKIGKGKTLI
jgi:hypothetical protein